MPRTKSLHNHQGVNLSASTKLSWQKNLEQINNPEQSDPRGAVWSGLSDLFLHHLDLQTVHPSPSQKHSACKAIDECSGKNEFLSSAHSRYTGCL